jgi:hypothetical protein
VRMLAGGDGLLHFKSLGCDNQDFVVGLIADVECAQ